MSITFLSIVLLWAVGSMVCCYVTETRAAPRNAALLYLVVTLALFMIAICVVVYPLIRGT